MIVFYILALAYEHLLWNINCYTDYAYAFFILISRSEELFKLNFGVFFCKVLLVCIYSYRHESNLPACWACDSFNTPKVKEAISTKILMFCTHFICLGLHLLDILTFLRKEEADDDLHLQLEVREQSCWQLS